MKVSLACACAVASLAVGEGTVPPQGQLLIAVGNPARLAVLDVATRHVRTLAPHHDFYDAVWSPDGRRIAFTDGDLFVMDSGGRHLTRLTRDDLPQHDAAWSPDGSRIAYLQQLPPTAQFPAFGPEDDLMVMNLRSGSVTQLTRDADNKVDVTWSPDGTEIAYEIVRHAGAFTAVLDLASGARTITGRSYPQWSRDGRSIAYNNGNSIVVSNRDGSGSHVVVRVGTNRDVGNLAGLPTGAGLRSTQAPLPRPVESKSSILRRTGSESWG